MRVWELLAWIFWKYVLTRHYESICLSLYALEPKESEYASLHTLEELAKLLK